MSIINAIKWKNIMFKQTTQSITICENTIKHGDHQLCVYIKRIIVVLQLAERFKFISLAYSLNIIIFKSIFSFVQNYILLHE